MVLYQAKSHLPAGGEEISVGTPSIASRTPWSRNAIACPRDALRNGHGPCVCNRGLRTTAGHLL